LYGIRSITMGTVRQVEATSISRLQSLHVAMGRP
jgi:hypothetical protein